MATQRVSETKRITKAFQTTSKGIKFGRALFGKGNTKLSPKMIADTLRLMGVNIPKEMVITLDVAQVIVSGSALYTAVNEYQSLDDLNEAVTAGAATVGAVTDLAIACGWVDGQDPLVQMIQVGSDVALIVASGGTNVSAYVSLAFHIASFEEMNKAHAFKVANQALQRGYAAIVTPEARAAAGVFKRYQESKNLPSEDPRKLSVFGFIGEIAVAAPNLWPQYFPEFKAWMPVEVARMSAWSESRSWYGTTQTSSASHSWERLRKMSPDDIRRYIFEGLVKPHVQPYYVAQEYFLKQNKAKLFSMALLGTLAGLSFIETGVDNSKVFDESLLTPYDLGDDVLQKYLSNLNDPYARIQRSSGVMSGLGTVVSQGSNKLLDDEREVFDNRSLLLAADQLGRIDVLNQFPAIKLKLKNAYSFDRIPYDKALGIWNEAWPPPPFGTRQPDDIHLLTGVGRAWRDPKNFFAALGMLETMKRDPFFRDTQLTSWLTQNFGFMGDLHTLDEIHRRAQMKQIIRTLNMMARFNIARFFGTTPDRLNKITTPEGVTQYEVI